MKWENGEREREGEERRKAGRSSLAGKTLESLAGKTLESLPHETKGRGRELSTLLQAWGVVSTHTEVALTEFRADIDGEVGDRVKHSKRTGLTPLSMFFHVLTLCVYCILLYFHQHINN